MAIPWVLQPIQLLGLYERFRDTNPSRLLQWFPTRESEEEGPLVQWDVLAYNRVAATLSARGAAPTTIAPPARGTFIAAAFCSSEQIPLKAQTLKNLRAPGETKVQRAESAVAQAIAQMTIGLNKRKAIFAAQCLGTASGNLSFALPGMTAATTVDLHYTTNHYGGTGNSCPITGSWSTHTTDIRTQIMAAKVLIEQDAGKVATELLCNSVTAQYLYKNDQVITTFTPMQNQELLATGHIKELYGLNIHEVNEVYVDAAGTKTKIVPDNFVSIFAGDNTHRADMACAPSSPKAPEDVRGMFFHSYEEDSIEDDVIVQYEAAYFPMLAMPDEVVFCTAVN